MGMGSLVLDQQSKSWGQKLPLQSPGPFIGLRNILFTGMARGYHPKDMLYLFLERACIGKQMPLHEEYVSPPRSASNPLPCEMSGVDLVLGDGKLESEVLPLEETILVLEIMDRVREIGGLKYPEAIEKV